MNQLSIDSLFGMGDHISPLSVNQAAGTNQYITDRLRKSTFVVVYLEGFMNSTMTNLRLNKSLLKIHPIILYIHLLQLFQ